MAYISGDTTIVEVGTQFPVSFRLPDHFLGLDDWSIYLENKDAMEITPVLGINVLEYGIYQAKAEIDGDASEHQQSIKVLDSSGLAIGDTIRIGNFSTKIFNIDPITHLITLEKNLAMNVPSGSTISKVVFPHTLGRYWFTMTPTQLGRFRVVIVDNNGIINPISDDLEVVKSLSSVDGTGRVTVLQNNATIG